MLVKEHLFWHNMAIFGYFFFFYRAKLHHFLVWVMPLAHQTLKDITSTSPGQVQLHVEPQAEERQQVHPTSWPCPLGKLLPEAEEPGWLPGTLPAKEAEFSQQAVWSPMAGADRKQDAPPGRLQGMTGYLQWEGYWDSVQLSGQSLGGPKWLSGKGRWVYCGQRGLVKEQCFPLAERLLAHHEPQPHICFISQCTRLSDLPSSLISVASDGGWKGCWPFKVKSSFPLLLRQMQLEPNEKCGSE